MSKNIMSKTPPNANYPAHPVSVTHSSAGDFWTSADHGYTGLTKREHFAALAMQSILTNAGRNGFEFTQIDKIACAAVDIADAQLEALELHD